MVAAAAAAGAGAAATPAASQQQQQQQQQGPLGDGKARTTFSLACPICHTTVFEIPASAAA